MYIARIFAVFLSAPILVLGSPVVPQSMEKCFGISLAGQSDGIEGFGAQRSASHSSVVDYQGNAWRLVDAGTCLSVTLPPMEDGTPRRGSLEPIARDLPNQ